MILIADSGSTKTDWALLTANGQSTRVQTDGINPFFQNEDAVRETVSNQLLPKIGHLLWAGTITHVFFYGAGCTPEKSPIVAAAVRSVFKKAQVEVASDMVGAARALLKQEKGIACILGTGSNSCYYNGSSIEWGVPALGFILGDEGSGAVLGKRLVADVLKNQLPESVKNKFLTQYNVTQADIIEHVYRQPFPNRYLASFSRFCAENIEEESVRRLVYDHFEQFVQRNLEQYFTPQTKQQMPVGFVGSIAYYYRDILTEVLQAHGMRLQQIMQAPMEGLMEYHKKDSVPTQV